MLDLKRLFEIWFQDPAFSVVEKLSFAGDHQGRLIANNNVDDPVTGGSAFDTLVAEFATVYQTAGGVTSSENIALAVRKARTFAKAQHLELLKDTVSKREGGIEESFGKESVQYLTFFPQGLTQYRTMKEAEVLPLLDQFISAANTYKPTLLGEFNGLRSTWLAVSGQAAQQAGAVSGADSAQDVAMAALEKQLMKNALTIALFFLTNEPDDAAREAKAALYFDQSKLHNPQQQSQSPTPPPPVP